MALPYRILSVVVLVMLSLQAVAAGNQWVYGSVEEVREYGSYGSNTFQVAIYLKETSWQGAGNGNSACIQTYDGRTFYRFRVVDGINGITASSQQRVFSMMLAAYMSGKRVALRVDTTGGSNCTVELAAVGDKY